ncbi:MAG: ankyrin repeat domain-containing protein [Candidatus Babeliaceae bacterium]
MLEHFAAFFKKADKTFCNFIDWVSDVHNQTLLSAAARKGFLESTEFLLKHGARVNARDNLGQTALFYAGQYPEIVKLLLKSGANSFVKNNKNQSVLNCLQQQKTSAPESIALVQEHQKSLSWFTNLKKRVSRFFGGATRTSMPLQKSLITLDADLIFLSKNL